MIQDWKKHLTDNRAEQCLTGMEQILELVEKVNPQVYVETGCGHLATFQLFHSLLPLREGTAIGIDIKQYNTWEPYNPDGYSDCHLIQGSLSEKETVDLFVEALGYKYIDVLFIDGDHNEEGVRTDWNVLRPYLRSGSLVIFHDYDPKALEEGKTEGQGAAIVCKDLQNNGYEVHSIEDTSIGTAYLYMP